MTRAKSAKARAAGGASAVPVRVMRNLLSRYLDMNRDLYRAEFLEEARGASVSAATLP